MPLVDPIGLQELFRRASDRTGSYGKIDTTLHRVTIHVPERDTDTTYKRGVGFRQTSPCGMFTARAKKVDAVRAALREHKLKCAECQARP